jgi:hypothetical protein
VAERRCFATDDEESMSNVMHNFRCNLFNKSSMRYFHCVRFEAFTAVTMKNGVFWDVTPCASCKNRHFGGA